jgi:hypothetical protein
MSYIRTEEIKQKQRETMLEVVKSYDFEEIDKKRKETIAKSGVKVGRRPGEGPPKTGEHRSCPVCDIDVYYTKKEISLQKVKCCSRKCLSKYPPYLEKLSNMDKSYMKTEEYKNTKRNPELPTYRKYINIVRRLTEITYVENMHILNPELLPRTICGVEGGMQLDHIKSVKQCWNEGISPEDAASVSNLQLIPWKDNLAKREFAPRIEKNDYYF